MSVDLSVLYEDNHLIAVLKPAGVPVQPDRTGDMSLMDMVKAYVRETHHKSGNVFLGLLHRLDRPVTGIVLFAKTSKGAARLSDQFRRRTIKKAYLALVETRGEKFLPKNGTLVHYLKKDTTRNVVSVYRTPVARALRAELDYAFESTVGNRALVRIELKTGRSHQIRVQLAALGYPIVGDKKYGAKTVLSGERRIIALLASELTFMTATHHLEKILRIDIPDNWL